MKKTALFLILSLVTMGCKKDEKTSIDPPGLPAKVLNDRQECLDLTEYKKLNDLPDGPEKDLIKADWLRKYGKGVCIETLYKYAIGTHYMGEIPFKIGEGEPLIVSWEDLKKLTDSFSVYEKYVSFKLDDSKKIIGIDTVPQFNKKIPCYSLALFRSIAKENTGYNISFKFTWAVVGTKNKETIIFEVINGKEPYSFFDFSDEPGIDEDYNQEPL